MKVLVACEESQSVCKELRALGHEAYSCDVLPCSGGKRSWHIQRDVLDVLYFMAKQVCIISLVLRRRCKRLNGVAQVVDEQYFFPVIFTCVD